MMRAPPLARAALPGHERDDRDIGNAQVMYRERCISFHSVRLDWQPHRRRQDEDGILPVPPRDASGHAWHHHYRLLFDCTGPGGSRLMEGRGPPGTRAACRASPKS